MGARGIPVDAYISPKGSEARESCLHSGCMRALVQPRCLLNMLELDSRVAYRGTSAMVDEGQMAEDHSDRLRDHAGRVQGWESVC